MKKESILNMIWMLSLLIGIVTACKLNESHVKF